VDAWERADLGALVKLLHEDAVLSMPPERSVVGAAAIVAFFRGHDPSRVRPRGTWVNGAPAVELLGRDGVLHRTLVLDVTEDGIATIHALRP
jgi:RNA polymerase sigma-70 factor (ECF subfamily)